jgi:hypothetical protein
MRRGKRRVLNEGLHVTYRISHRSFITDPATLRPSPFLLHIIFCSVTLSTSRWESLLPIGQPTPKRIVLRCREQYFQDQRAMVEAFFKSQNLSNLEDYGIHICGEPSSPTILYLVLDLHCKEIPNVNLSKLELQVFKVSRNNTL